MKKTALQEAIEHLTKESLSTGNSNRDVIKYLESLLEKEKQDLCEQKQLGYADGYKDATNDILSSL